MLNRFARAAVVLVMSAAIFGVAAPGFGAPGDPALTEPDLDPHGFGNLRRTPTPDDRLRVLIYGDSVAFTLFDAMTPSALDEQVSWIGRTRLGFGFLADWPLFLYSQRWDADFPDWRADIDSYIADHDPDVVVVHAGAMDTAPRQVDGDWVVTPEAAWAVHYVAALEDAFERFAARGARVTWVGLPCLGNPNAWKVGRINGFHRDLVARYPDQAGFIDLEPAACPDGSFTMELPGRDGEPLRARMDDLVHFEKRNAATLFEDFFTEQYLIDWSR